MRVLVLPLPRDLALDPVLLLPGISLFPTSDSTETTPKTHNGMHRQAREESEEVTADSRWKLGCSWRSGEPNLEKVETSTKAVGSHHRTVHFQGSAEPRTFQAKKDEGRLTRGQQTGSRVRRCQDTTSWSPADGPPWRKM